MTSLERGPNSLGSATEALRQAIRLVVDNPSLGNKISAQRAHTEFFDAVEAHAIADRIGVSSDALPGSSSPKDARKRKTQ